MSKERTNEAWELDDVANHWWTHWWVQHGEYDFTYYERFDIKLRNGREWGKDSQTEWYWCDWSNEGESGVPCQLYSAEFNTRNNDAEINWYAFDASGDMIRIVDEESHDGKAPSKTFDLKDKSRDIKHVNWKMLAPQ